MIFAAGLGTRLRPLTDTMPKALVPVGNSPLLEHVLRKLVAAGYDDVVINVHHFAPQIAVWVEQHPMPGLTVHLSDESRELLETGGGIRHAAPLLGRSDPFLIHNVDILSNVQLPALRAAFRGDAMLLVSERDTQRYLIFDDDMRLVGWTNIQTGEVRTPFPAVREAFDEDYVAPVNSIAVQTSPFFRPRGTGPYRLLAFSGIQLMSPRLLPLMSSWPERFSIIDFYLKVCRERPIYGYEQPGLRLMDVGKYGTLDKAAEFLASIE